MEWKYSIYEYVQDYISVSFVEKKNCGAEECAMSCIVLTTAAVLMQWKSNFTINCTTFNKLKLSGTTFKELLVLTIN